MLATAVTATSTASSVSTTTTTAATSLFARLGFVDGQRTTVVIFLVQATDRFIGGIVIPHFNEAETLAAAGVTILNDLSTPHLTELTEQSFEI
jgi:hypothetical protein